MFDVDTMNMTEKCWRLLGEMHLRNQYETNILLHFNKAIPSNRESFLDLKLWHFTFAYTVEGGEFWVYAVEYINRIIDTDYLSEFPHQ